MAINHHLLVLGSQNAKKEDQKIDRSKVRPVQLVTPDERVKQVNFFNDWGKVGVSSIAWDLARFPDELFVSVNDEIRRLNAKTREFEVLDLGEIGDLHDIHFIDDLLWISNTEYDQAIGYDAEKRKVVEKRSLDTFRLSLDDIDRDEDIEKVKDRFHCNQVFRDYNGDLCVLIHSINGWLFYRVLFEMLVKKQGDGGIINLDKQEVIQLRLQSPHSVRKIDGDYWVQDSSDLSTKIFDKEWQFKDTIKTGGFGRGVDFSDDDTAYIGLSATRKRYLKLIPTSEYHSNRILVVGIDKKDKRQEIPIPNIEQLDNVYILDEPVRKLFEELV
ncbi:DUF4915 domain-containing protein [Gracilimonas sp.]|uniref:DUF4915 domain-containing protein n=1 Tax=Gracilimonas sp. TaxID=1974203 RepID=UPI0032EDDD36